MNYSVGDKKMNWVVGTYPCKYLFGGGKSAGATVCCRITAMNEFTSKPGVPNGFGIVQGAANAVAAGKRPLSAMTPTILRKNGKVLKVTGSPGGTTIIT